MLERSGCPRAALISGPHRWSRQSLLALILASGCFPGAVLRASSDPDYGQIPLTFIANRGQTHDSVRFTAKAPGFAAYFTTSEIIVDLRRSVIRMRYLGSNPAADIDGADLQQGRANFLIGNDSTQWRTDVPLYGRIVYTDLYPGIDMMYSAHQRLLKSEFVVAPGADASRIQIEYSGADSLRLDDRGELILTTSGGELTEEAPEIYQEIDGVRAPVSGAFRVSGNVVSFFVGEYDRSRPLRIDPVLSYSTYLGGSGTERAQAIAVDSTGSAYVAGYTDSPNFPVAGSAPLGAATFVKTDSTTQGSWKGVYGSNGYNVISDTTSYPGYVTATTSGSFNTYTWDTQSTDIRALQEVSSSTYRIASVWWTFTTLNIDLTFTDQGTHQVAFYCLDWDFVNRSQTITVQDANGVTLDTRTVGNFGGGQYLVWNLSGSVRIVITQTAGINAVLSGLFFDPPTGTTPSGTGVQSTSGGSVDAFVTKLNPAGSAIVYSTYLGGSGDDRAFSIAVNASGNAFFTG